MILPDATQLLLFQKKVEQSDVTRVNQYFEVISSGISITKSSRNFAHIKIYYIINEPIEHN